MKLLTKTISVGALLVGSVCSAFATPITPGTTVVPNGIASLGTTSTLATTGSVVLVSNGGPKPSTFSASYTESVITSSANPFGPSALAFVMTFSNLAGSKDAIERATNGFGTGFLGYNASVSYLLGAGVAPTTADESAFSGTIGFQFPGVLPGQSAKTFIIFTNATNYQTANFSLIDNQTATGAGFIPDVAVGTTPEPSSLILLGTGLIGAASTALRRRRMA